MTFAIDKDIAIPASKTSVSKYPFATLEVGQSFFVPGGNLKPMRVLCAKKGKGTDKRFITREMEGTVNGVVLNGVRVWRYHPAVELAA